MNLKRFCRKMTLTLLFSLFLLLVVDVFSPTMISAEPDSTWIATKNTVRIRTSNPLTAAVTVSQTVWPATMKENRPGAIIITNPKNLAVALTSLRLIHHPIDGPVLFVENNRVPEITLREIKRLKPKGVSALQGVQLILVGDISEKVKRELESSGYKTDRVLTGTTPASAAVAIDAYAAKLSGNLPKIVIIGSSDSLAYTAPAAYWTAHMPEPLLYVSQNAVPEETKAALQKRTGQAVMYVLGPQSVISEAVIQQLSGFGKVKRISGNNPIDNSITFAKYKDPETGFGWGILTPGHNLSFVPQGNVPLLIASGPFAHKGKHSPLIWTKRDQLTDSIMQYLLELQPKYVTTPTEGPYDFAWITGSLKDISYDVQGQIDHLVEIVPASGMEHDSGPMGH